MFIVNAIKKTIRYGKKNGIRPAFYTAIERMQQRKEAEKCEEILTKEQIEEQISYQFEKNYVFSILVPAYETKPVYLRRLITSVLDQTYPFWELVVADASSSTAVKETVQEYADARIRYYKLKTNDGISANTNQAMQFAMGDYCALLDHDDFLTEDALFEMALAIEKTEKKGVKPAFLYSDEDKCNAEETLFFDRHEKLDFNYDLLLTNNYICHFLVIETQLLKSIGFRKEYDGAQDFDLVLRLVMAIEKEYGLAFEERICHIPKVLYHWRCHQDSTADNPESKMYAYEAGRRAIEDFYRQKNIKAVVKHSSHLGFYDTFYESKNELFQNREDIGIVGGLLLTKGHVSGGAYIADGKGIFNGLPQYFAGKSNRAHLMQDVDAVDIRCMMIAPSWEALYQEVMGFSYVDTLPSFNKKKDAFGIVIEKERLPEAFKTLSEEEIIEKSLIFCKKVRENGQKVVLYPKYRRVIKNR